MTNKMLLLPATVVFLVAVLPFTTDRTPQAAPGLSVSSILGTIVHGSTLMISGSGFGTKPTGSPLKWDDFEGGGSGNALSGWDFTGTVNPTYSTGVRRTNSTMSGRANFTQGSWGSNFGIDNTTFNTVYFDAWYYYDVTYPVVSRNHKLFRLHANTSGSPNLYYNVYCNTAGHFSQDGVSTGRWHVWPNIGSDYFASNWAHIQVYLQASSPGGTDGVAHMWIDGVKVVNENAFTTREAGDSTWNALWFGNYLGHDAEGSCAAIGDTYTYWDDVYVDTTPARVEIGDASTYSASRHREIQLPDSWSDSAISVRLNRGGFSSFSGLYLYVVDAQGNASPGYPLSSSGTLPDPPSPPTNLRIQ